MVNIVSRTATTAAIAASSLAALAIAQIRQSGCEYGDIRVCAYRQQNLMARDRSLSGLSDRESSGFGVRVLWDGAWGFAASPHRRPVEVVRVVDEAIAIAKASRWVRQTRVDLAPEVTHRDTYRTPIHIDPFSIPLTEKADLLLHLTDRLLSYSDRGVKKAYAFLQFAREETFFASTEGSEIAQTIYRTYPGFGCTAIANGDAQQRNYERPPLNIGYEHVDRDDLVGQVERVAEEAIEKVNAPQGPQGVRSTLVLKPSHLYLTIHESVGHPLELDRVYGYEANFAGTSFATTDKLHQLQYAAPWVNFVADRQQAGGRSTVAYDAEGVPAQSWHVIKDGMLNDYLCDRETAHRLGRDRSNGCAFADSWASVPMVRIPNLGLEAGPNDGGHTAKLAEMIADTESGILIDGVGSFSIDQQRRNFQFGGDAFWQIENGRITGMLKDVTYHAMTTEFWNSVDAIGPESEREQTGTHICGKGEPMQIAQMTHACVPVRVRNIQVGGAER
ncbi:MAG: TldD/PmbA family protein [Cyanobacteria bacterium P01_F01_bin.33]